MRRNLDCLASPVEQVAVPHVKPRSGGRLVVLRAATPERGVPGNEIEKLFPERRSECVKTGRKRCRVLQRNEVLPVEGLACYMAVRHILEGREEAGEVQVKVRAVLAD